MLSWLFNLFSSGHSLSELSRRLGVSSSELKSTSLGYHEFSIRKKSGKLRSISAPNSQLKSLQRKILRRLLAKLRSHACATGFQPGVSFVDNARCHQSQEVVIRIDLVDFFPSIRSETITHYFRKIGWSSSAADLLTQLTTHQGGLPQGAPTSPRLSNLIHYHLDASISSVIRRSDRTAIYTRYADDITISSSHPSFDPEEIIQDVLAIIRAAGYRPHVGKKFDVRRQHQRQVVTGLVVNEKANLSREKRRWLRAVDHRLRQKMAGGYVGPSPSLTQEQLDGWNNLRKMIDAQ